MRIDLNPEWPQTPRLCWRAFWFVRYGPWLIWAKYLHFGGPKHDHWGMGFHRYGIQLLIKRKLKLVPLMCWFWNRTIARTFMIKIVNELFASESMVLKEQDMIWVVNGIFTNSNHELIWRVESHEIIISMDNSPSKLF